MAGHVGIISSCSCFPALARLPRLASPDRKPFAVAAMGDDPIREWILSEGKATQITRISPVGGGCINSASRYDTDAGLFFVKTNRRIGPSMFEAEALGLGAMYETGTIRVPRPFKVGALPTSGSFIIMEFVEFGASRGNQPVLGKKLAEMHKAGKSAKGFGFDVDNTIGSTPQINTWSSDWVQFYGEHRLGYQLKLALEQYGDRSIYDKGQRLVKSMGPLFEGVVIEPCLLHGDLWSGNISSDKKGEPVILDPACYYGHNEAEFGMSWCAGFAGALYDAYFKVMPKQPGYEKRRDIYLLYHYLNHYSLFDARNEAEFGMSWCAEFAGAFCDAYFEVMPKQPGYKKRRDNYLLYHYLNHYNLFGSGYHSSAMSIINDYLRMLNA